MKKAVISLGVIATIMLVFTTAYAYNQNTGYVLGPEAYSGQTTRGSTYSLKTAYAPVTGAETSVYFKNLGSLRENVVVSGYRELNIVLLEEDMAPNADDEVRKYTGTFDGLQLKTIQPLGVVQGSEGNIESASDDTAELYIKMTLTHVNGDKTTTNGPMFYYDIRLN